MLHIILVESALELMPAELQGQRVVKKSALIRGKKPSEILLDSNFHHAAMKGIEDEERRGRPDIAHICLLYLLDSPLNREGKLVTYIHTRDDKIIFINASCRIPRSYNRFCGLMEKLLLEGEIKTRDATLMRLEQGNVEKLIADIKPEATFLLDENGKSVKGFYESLTSFRDPCVIIGGFPSGEYKGEYPFAESISIYPTRLCAWTAACEVVSNYYRYEHDER